MFNSETKVKVDGKDYILRIIKNVITNSYDFYLYTLDGQVFSSDFDISKIKIIDDVKNFVEDNIDNFEKLESISEMLGCALETENVKNYCSSVRDVCANDYILDSNLSENNSTYCKSLLDVIKYVNDNNKDLKELFDNIYDKANKVNLFNISIKDLISKTNILKEKEALLESKKKYYDTFKDETSLSTISILEGDILLINATILGLKRIIINQSKDIL